MKQHHLIVFGAGSGGLVCAAGAAMMGVRVALLEKHRMGGDCLNTGCVPSKAIIRAAKLAYDARRASDFGLEAQLGKVDLRQVLGSVRGVIGKIAHHDSVERFSDLGVDVKLGSYRFINPQEITNGSETLQAKRFVIATGSRPRIPDLPGLTSASLLTSENVWDLEELPERLVVLGGGPIGCELAQTFARLGSKVTLVQRRNRILPREDPDASQVIQEIFRKEGIQLLLGCHHRRIREEGSRWVLELEHSEEGRKEIVFDRILIAAGRSPNVEGLDLEKVGIHPGPHGLDVDSYLRTSAKHIYACGDIIGPYLFTHTADHQARTVLRNALFPGKSKINYQIIPWSTFTDPEVARVGMNEQEAQKRNLSYDVFHYPLRELDRAVCDREEEGFIKVLTQKGKDRILGVTLISSHGGDLLGEMVLAMKQGVGLKTLANLIHIYPTLSEINKRVSGVFQSSRLTPTTKKWLGRFFRWRFG